MVAAAESAIGLAIMVMTFRIRGTIAVEFRVTTRFYQGGPSPRGKLWDFHATWTEPSVDAKRHCVPIIILGKVAHTSLVCITKISYQSKKL